MAKYKTGHIGPLTWRVIAHTREDRERGSVHFYATYDHLSLPAGSLYKAYRYRALFMGSPWIELSVSWGGGTWRDDNHTDQIRRPA